MNYSSESSSKSTAGCGTTPRGCPMIDGLYLKANGELPCWCFYPAEYHILHRLTYDDLSLADATILGLPELARIRRTFKNGELPFPEMCPGCAALGIRTVDDVEPGRLDHLMIEPSYLCNLDCPECLSPTYRLTLKEAPYLMSPEFFRAFLDRLRSDGIEEVGLAHFEGRGDPMLNEHLGSMLTMIRDAFPGVQTILTTHGNYSFEPFLMSGDLDVLRLSIDGAYAESYARYRRGGSLDKVLGLLREIRARRRLTRSRLRVEWKYILFEWNDSDEELAQAARMADELEARLHFVMTNTDGLSQRFSDPFDWFIHLRRIAPTAQLSVVDDGKAKGRIEDYRQRMDAPVERHISAAYYSSRNGWSPEAAEQLDSALRSAEDPNQSVKPGVFFPVEDLPRVMKAITEGKLVEALAEIALANEEFCAAEELYVRFLQLQPETERRQELERLLVHLILRGRLGTADQNAFFDLPAEQLAEAEKALLRIHPGFFPGGTPPSLEDRPEEWLSFVEDAGAIRALGYLRWARGDFEAAHRIFSSYLESPRPVAEIQAIGEALEAIDLARGRDRTAGSSV